MKNNRVYKNEIRKLKKNRVKPFILHFCGISIISLFLSLNAEAQFNYGTGAEGKYTAPLGASTLSGTHNYSSFIIPAGGTVTVTGEAPLVIMCTDTISISGVLTAAGGAGSVRNANLGGAGGVGGGGGWGGAGGAGGSTSSQKGINGVSFCPACGFNGNGVGGNGYGGASTLQGGTGGGYGTQGGIATDCGSGCGAENDNVGNYYGDAGIDITKTIGTITTNLFGGSGGGGGGGRLAGFDEGGGGGGGGAGAIQLTGSVVVLTGQVSVRGGDAPDDLGTRAGVGGGGSGGTLVIQYKTSSTVPATANIDPSVSNALADIAGGWGGNHGHTGSTGTYTVGGNGGQGRYLEQQDNSCTNAAFTSQPASTGTLCSPASASFSVTVTGDSPTYEWQVLIGSNWTNLTDGGTNPAYTGTSTVTLNVSNATATAQYRCDAINCSGHNSLSNPATMTVIMPASFTSITPSEIKCAGDTATFKVVAIGDALSYQWSQKGTPIPAATLSSLSFNPVAAADSGSYTCNAGNTCKSFTPGVHITVHQKAVITDTVSNQETCEGDSLILTVVATGLNLSYQWTKGGNNISGATGSVYNTGKLSSADYDYYSCNVINGCGTTAMPQFIINVNTPPKSNIIYINQIKNENDSVSYTLSPGGTGPFSFQWYKSDVKIDGATNSAYNINPIACADSGIYTCTIKNDCDSIYTKVARLYVLNCSRFKFAVSGYVKYDNQDSTVMSSKTPATTTTVYLENAGDVLIDSVNTDDNGYYAFVDLINGSYKLSCSTKKPWGGVNPIDALIINRTYIGLYSLTDAFKRLAADVNNDSKINPIDALLVNRRYINLIHKFTIPDWLFQAPPVTIDGVSVTINILAICAGDVNTSDVPPAKPLPFPDAKFSPVIDNQ